MLNRSWSRVSIILILIGGFFVPPLSSFPAQRRTLTIVDRLMRANPLRALANYIGQKLSFEVYYPPRTNVQKPTKVPDWMPMYYSPAMAMIAPVHQQQPVQMIQGSYSMPRNVIQQAVAAYKPILVESYKQNQAYLMPATSASTSNQVYNSIPIGPTTVVNTNGNNGNENSIPASAVRVIVLQPSDLQRMEGLHPQQSTNLMKDYNMKFIDLEDDASEESLALPMEVSSHLKPKSVNPAVGNVSCTSPFCHPFLKKLIPELLALPSELEQDVRDVILTNNTIINLGDSNNSQEEEEEESEEEPSVALKAESSLNEFSHDNSAKPTQAVRLLYNTQPKKLISSRINSTRIQKYEPRNKPYAVGNQMHQNVYKQTHNRIINSFSTNSAKIQHQQPTPTSASHLVNSPAHPLMKATLERFEIDDAFPHRYGTSGKQRVTPGGSSLNLGNFPGFTTTSAHYTAGIVYNGPKSH